LCPHYTVSPVIKLGIHHPRKKERKKSTDSADSELFKATALRTRRCQWICYNVTLGKGFCFRATHTGRRTGLFLFTHRDNGGLLWKTTHKRAGKACTYPQMKTNHLGTTEKVDSEKHPGLSRSISDRMCYFVQNTSFKFQVSSLGVCHGRASKSDP